MREGHVARRASTTIPAFPYTSYQRMTLDDLRDLFAYLKTLPAVQGKVRDHDLPFPFNIRRLLGGWKLLFLDGKPFRPDPAQSAQWNRGAYLVNGPGHCAECHCPRNLLGGIVASQRFAGGPEPGRRGLGPQHHPASSRSWSEDDIADLLETGMTPDGDSVGGHGRGDAQYRAARRPTIAPRWRPISSRCRRSKGRSRRRRSPSKLTRWCTFAGMTSRTFATSWS